MSLVIGEPVKIYLARGIDGDAVVIGTIEEADSDWIVVNDDSRVLYINKDYVIAIEEIDD